MLKSPQVLYSQIKVLRFLRGAWDDANVGLMRVHEERDRLFMVSQKD